MTSLRQDMPGGAFHGDVRLSSVHMKAQLTPVDIGTAYVRPVALAGLLLACGLFVCGCEDSKQEPSAIEMIQYLPLAMVVPAGQELSAAEEYASRHPGESAMWGVADGMIPHYGDHGGLVIRQFTEDELRPGMTVVYLTPGGWQAGGLLVGKVSGGWNVRDWGATVNKDAPVPTDSILGIVVIAFVSQPQHGGS